MQQEAEHHEHERDVLRVTDRRVRAGLRKAMFALCDIQHRPRSREEPEARDDERGAEQVERAEMRVRAPSEDHFEQMPGVVRKEIDLRKAR